MNTYVISINITVDAWLDPTATNPALEICPKVSGAITSIDAMFKTIKNTDSKSHFLQNIFTNNHPKPPNTKAYDYQVLTLPNQYKVGYRGGKVYVPSELAGLSIDDWPPLGVDVSYINEKEKKGFIQLTLVCFDNNNKYNKLIRQAIPDAYIDLDRHYIYNSSETEKLSYMSININHFVGVFFTDILKALEVKQYGDFCMLIQSMVIDLNPESDNPDTILAKLFDKL